MTAAALHPNLAVVASWLLAVAATPALVGCSDGGEGTEPPAGCEPPPSTDAAVPFVDATAELGIDAEWHGESFCTLQEQAGSGTCVFDFDGDGDADIFFPDRGGYPNKLYRNDGDGFVDVAAATGVALTADESAGCLPFDYDADGDLDLFVANAGYDRLLRNDAGTFVDVSQEAGLPDNDKFSLWAAAGDIDLDGDLDIDVVVANINGKHQVLLNQQSAGHALMVSLDTLASGAQVRVVADGRQLTEHVRLGAMYSGSRDPRVHFGLGDQCRADVVVTYPGGEIQEFPDVPSNQVFDLSRR